MPTTAAAANDTGTANNGYQLNAPGAYCWTRFCTTYVAYAPIMRNSPWAMLITPMRPYVIARPSAASNNTLPSDKPAKIVPTISPRR